MKPISVPKPSRQSHRFMKDGFHRFHKLKLEALGMRSMGAYRFNYGEWHEVFISRDGTIEVRLGFLRCPKRPGTHTLQLRTYGFDQLIGFTDALERANERSIEKQDILTQALRAHIESVEQSCEQDCDEKSTSVAIITPETIPLVWEFIQVSDKLANQKFHVSEASKKWQSWSWIPQSWRRPLFLRNLWQSA